MLDKTGVNNENYTVNRDGCLCNVGGKDDFSRSLRRGLEDLGLQITREVGVDLTDNKFRDLVTQDTDGLLNVLLRRFDFVLSLMEV